MNSASRRICSGLVCAVAVAFAAAPAPADAVAVTSISVADLRFDLVDLDPTDGIAPSFEATFSSHYVSSWAYERIAMDRFETVDTVSDWPMTPPGVATSAVQGASFASAVVGGSSLLDGISFELAGSAEMPPGGHGYSTQGQFDAAIFSRIHYALSAMTGLRIYGTLTMSASAPGGEYANAEFEIGLSGYTGEYWDDVFRRELEAGTPPTPRLVGVSSSNGLIDIPFELLLANERPESVRLLLDSRTVAYGAAPVPEAGSVSLALVGLAVIAAVTHRRRSAVVV